MIKKLLIGLATLVILVGTTACSANPKPITPPTSPTTTPPITLTPAAKLQDIIDIDLSELIDIVISYWKYDKRADDYARLLNKNVRVSGEAGGYEPVQRLLTLNVPGRGGYLNNSIVIDINDHNPGFRDLFRNLNPPGMKEKRLLEDGKIVTIEGKFLGRKSNFGDFNIGYVECYKLILDGKEYIISE